MLESSLLFTNKLLVCRPSIHQVSASLSQPLATAFVAKHSEKTHTSASLTVLTQSLALNILYAENIYLFKIFRCVGKFILLQLYRSTYAFSYRPTIFLPKFFFNNTVIILVWHHPGPNRHHVSRCLPGQGNNTSFQLSPLSLECGLKARTKILKKSLQKTNQTEGFARLYVKHALTKVHPLHFRVCTMHIQ